MTTVRGFSKIKRVFIWKLEVLQALLPRRRIKTPNKESSKKENKRINSRACKLFVTF